MRFPARADLMKRWRGSTPRARVFQIIVDGLHPRILQREIAAGRVPHLAWLVSNGKAKWDTVSIFPTNTPPAIASITTGEGPHAHHIPGMYWWDRGAPGPVYYGERLNIISSHFDSFFENIVGWLNMRHLNPHVRTVFEHLEEKGLSTASINNLCFRGPHRHPTTLPYFLRVIPGVRFTLEHVGGPRHFRFGDFARSGSGEARIFGDEGPFKQFGISDPCTLNTYLHMAEHNELPDYVHLYFPDNDVWSHEHGPEATGVSIQRLDRKLGQIFDTLGGRERAIAENNFLLTADHAQVPIGTTRDSAIDLDEVLADFDRLPLGSRWKNEEMFLCPNGRFGQIYLHAERPWLRNRVIEALRQEPRIEFALWRDGTTCHVLHPCTGRHLSFALGGRMQDRFGHAWSVWGDTGTLALEFDGREVFSYRYPDALLRIYEALLTPTIGDILLTAEPGREFAGNGEDIHMGGGSHGGLLAEESLVPFIACGPGLSHVGEPRRTTEILDQSLALFGLDRRTGRHAA